MNTCPIYNVQRCHMVRGAQGSLFVYMCMPVNKKTLIDNHE